MEEEYNIIVKWAQEDVETSYNLLNDNNPNEEWEFIFNNMQTLFESKVELHLSGGWLSGSAWPSG